MIDQDMLSAPADNYVRASGYLPDGTEISGVFWLRNPGARWPSRETLYYAPEHGDPAVEVDVDYVEDEVLAFDMAVAAVLRGDVDPSYLTITIDRPKRAPVEED